MNEQPHNDGEASFSGSDRQRIFVFLGVIAGMLMAAMDQSIISPALPTIVGDLTGVGSYSWLVTGYLITVTVTIALYGRLSDIYGRGPVYSFAIVTFLIGSILSGFAGQIPILNQYMSGMAQITIFRAIQGIGGGGLLSMATIIVGDLFSPRERGKYISYVMVLFGLATMGGPILGGYLTEHFTWRWIFFINIPIGLVALGVVQTHLDLPVPSEDHTIDYLGALLLTVATVTLLLITTWGGSRFAWGSGQILGLAGVLLASIGLFVYQELRIDDPIFPVSLLGNRTIAGIDFIGFSVVGIGLLGGLTYLPIFLQTVLNVSGTNAGLLLLPLIGGFIVLTAVTGQFMSWLGYYKPFTVAGTALAAGGYYILSTMGVNTSLLWASAFMFVTGSGLGLTMPTLEVGVQNAVEREDLGVVTSSVMFSRTLGEGVGVAILGAVLGNQLSNRLTETTLDESTAQHLIEGGEEITPSMLNSLSPEAAQVVTTVLSNSFSAVFLAAAVIMVVGFVVALTLPNAELGEDVPVENETGGEATQSLD